MRVSIEFYHCVLLPWSSSMYNVQLKGFRLVNSDLSIPAVVQEDSRFTCHVLLYITITSQRVEGRRHCVNLNVIVVEREKNNASTYDYGVTCRIISNNVAGDSTSRRLRIAQREFLRQLARLQIGIRAAGPRILVRQRFHPQVMLFFISFSLSSRR